MQKVGWLELDLALDGQGVCPCGRMESRRRRSGTIEQPAVVDHRAAGQGAFLAHGPHVQEADPPVSEGLGDRDGERRPALGRRPGPGPPEAAFAFGERLQIGVVARADGDPADHRAVRDACHPSFDHRASAASPDPAGPGMDLDFILDRHL